MEEARSKTSIKNEPVSDNEEITVLLEEVTEQVCVKKEPGTEVDVKIERIYTEEHTQETVEEQACLSTIVKSEIVEVKGEPGWDGTDWDPSEEQSSLYAGHEIKGDLVIGTEALQPADAVFATVSSFGGKTCKQEAECEPDNSLLIKKIKTKQKEKSSHLVVRTPKTYTCDICNRSYSLKRLLIRHIYYHGYKKPYYCKICDKHFTSQTYGSIHKRKHTGDRRYHCEICQKQFTCSSSLTKHKRTHTTSKPHVCEICQKQFKEKSQLVLHLLTHQGETAKRYTCKFCSRKFTHRYQLVNHTRLHTGVKPFTCDICNKQFSLKYYLHDHLREHAQEAALQQHRNGKPTYACKTCRNRYLTAEELAGHERRFPSGSCVKSFPCATCAKSFKGKRELKRHERTHTGEKPYPCDICGRPFSQQAHLKAHRLLHTGQKDFACDLCEKRFTVKRCLSKHMEKAHTGEGRSTACKYCGKEFTRPCSLALHEKAHVKPGKRARSKSTRVRD